MLFFSAIALGVEMQSFCRLGADVTLQSFENASHLGLLRDDRTISVILQILSRHHSRTAKAQKAAQGLWDWALSGFGWSGPSKPQPRRELTARKEAVTVRHPAALQDLVPQ